MEYKSKITNLGHARLATALAEGETVSISTIRLGDGGGNPVEVVDESRTTLINEVYSGPVNSLTVSESDPSIFIVEAIIPQSAGGWNVAEFGLVDNTGALVAIGNFPVTYKPAEGENASKDLVIRVYIDVGAGNEGLIVIDPYLVTATRDWVQSNFALSVLLPGGTTGQILSKASNVDGDVDWIDPLDGFTITVDVIEENQTLSAGQTVVNLLVATTDALAVFIDGIRLRNNEFSIVSETQLTLNAAATSGQKLTAVQNEPSGSNDYLRAVNNLADVSDANAARGNIGAAADSAVLKKSQNLADVNDKAAARGNIGAAADSEVLKKSQNLSDVNDKAAARGNLGVNTRTEILQFLYPVGEIYGPTRRNANPSETLGFGTWEPYAPGMVLVGLDSNQSEFNAIDKEGGAKTHKLTENELPAHKHKINGRLGDGATDEVDFGAAIGQAAKSAYTENTGGNQPHNNLQPYKVVRYWKRLS